MLLRDTTRVWVIFDTCTKPDYYLDLHNVLAAPSGAVVRYEYREKHISKEALAAAGDPLNAPKQAILFYVQSKDFQKGATAPAAGTVIGLNDGLWIATRVAEMKHLVRDGEVIYFDFVVSDYPNQNPDTLKGFLEPLIAAKAVPFWKWVSVCRDVEKFRSLRTGNPNANWEEIVRILSEKSQFAGDLFWRIKSLTHAKSHEECLPIYVEEKTSADPLNPVRGVHAGYLLLEGRTLCAELTTHSASSTVACRPSPQSSVAASADEANLLVSVDPRSLPLRPHSSAMLRITAKQGDRLSSRQGTLTIASPQSKGTFPLGPNVVLRLLTRKSWPQVVISAIASVLGTAIFALAFKTWDTSHTWGGVQALTGVALFASGLMLYFRKLGFKPA